MSIIRETENAKASDARYAMKYTRENRVYKDDHPVCWVVARTPRGTNVDLLVPSNLEIIHYPSRPRLGAVNNSDRTGGFTPGERYTVSETATAREYVAMQERTVPSPFAGKEGLAVNVFPAGTDPAKEFEPVVELRFDDDSTMIFPASWLSRAGSTTERA